MDGGRTVARQRANGLLRHTTRAAVVDRPKAIRVAPQRLVFVPLVGMRALFFIKNKKAKSYPKS